MKGSDVLRIVDQMQHEKNIDREIVFSAIEEAMKLAGEKKYGEDASVAVTVNRDTGDIVAKKGGESFDPMDLGRIFAQLVKQLMIQKIREAECKAVYDEYSAMKGDLVNGPLARHEGGSALISLGKTESLLPRSEQIPGEMHHVGERVKAVVLDVRKQGHRVKIILSRVHPDFVRRLFEGEIPEIAERTIEIKALAREAGYRCKIAVSSIDLKVDCVGACVGVRGSRIKNIVDELGGERIDIVRWNDSLQIMIPNALQPASVDEVFLFPRLGRAIVLVKDDQLSLAIGRRGQNVRLASKLVGWDIEIMTFDEYNEGVEKADHWFNQIPGSTPEMVQTFIEEGFLSFDDLTFLENAELGELAGVSEEDAEQMIAYAEEMSERMEQMKDEEPAEDEMAGRTMAGQLQMPPAEGETAPAEDGDEAPSEDTPTEEGSADDSEAPAGEGENPEDPDADQPVEADKREESPT